MNRAAAGDLVDILNIRLMRVGAIQQAIQVGCEEGLSQEEIFTLSNIAGDGAHKAQTELDKWWHGLAMEK